MTGSMTALITPFNDNGDIAWDDLKKVVELQIEGGTDAIVPCGTTGEASTLSYDEHIEVVSAVVTHAKGRVKVIAGAGSNSTAEARDLTEFAKKSGADASLHVAPYYNKPTQEGMYQHFSLIATIELPLILYNIPGRTNVNMSADTVARLAAENKNIIGLKEATGSITQASETIIAVRNAGRNDFILLSGDDALTLPMMAVGAQGVISVISNLYPAMVKSLVSAAASGDYARAREIHDKNFAIMTGMFIETSPAPIKEAMWQKGIIKSPMVRLPLVRVKTETAAAIKKLLV